MLSAQSVFCPCYELLSFRKLTGAQRTGRQQSSGGVGWLITIVLMLGDIARYAGILTPSPLSGLLCICFAWADLAWGKRCPLTGREGAEDKELVNSSKCQGPAGSSETKPNQEKTVRVEWTVGTVAGNMVGELGVYVRRRKKLC